MVGKPEDVYNPIPSVSPSTGSPNGGLNVRATPNDFGGQIGQAVQGLGNTFDKLGDQAMGIAIQRQGMMNETFATNAESEYSAATGEIYGKYKALQGYDAVHAREGTVNDILAVRQKIRATLPNAAAQRAFDLLAVRREGFMVQDINAYAGGQIKVADTTSAKNALEGSVESASRPEIANNDALFGAALGTIKFQALRILSNEGWGSVIHQDPQTGAVTFDDTPEGKNAEATYTNFINKATGEAWERRIKTLAIDPTTGNIQTAVKVLKDNQKAIPADTYAKLSAYLSAPFKQAQIRNISDDILGDAVKQYTIDLGAGIAGKYNPVQITQAIIGQESGGDPNAKSFAGATGLGQIMPSTWKAYAHPGEDIHNAKDQLAVTQRIITDLYNKYNGDVERMAVAYYSGPNNVAPAGSPTPWIKDIDKSKDGHDIPSVSEYVGNIVKRLGGKQGIGPTGYINQADWLETHWGDVLGKARQMADTMYPDDPALADAAVKNTESRMREIIMTQRYSDRADQETLLKAIQGDYTNGKPLTDIDQLAAIPEVKDIYYRFHLNNPNGANQLGNIIRANLHGPSVTYGTQFWHYYTKVANGEITDPNQLLTGVNGDVAPKDSPLTNTGFNFLNGMIKQASTPQGHSNLQTIFKTLVSPEYKGAVTLTGAGPGWVDKDGDKLWNEYLQNVLPKIQAGLARNVSVHDLFDPKSKDYVGAPPHRSQKQWFADLTNGLLTGKGLQDPGSPLWKAIGMENTPTGASTYDLKSIVDTGSFKKALADPNFIKEVQAGHITKQQFMDLANKFNPPPVPREH